MSAKIYEASWRFDEQALPADLLARSVRHASCAQLDSFAQDLVYCRKQIADGDIILDFAEVQLAFNYMNSALGHLALCPK